MSEVTWWIFSLFWLMAACRSWLQVLVIWRGGVHVRGSGSTEKRWIGPHISLLIVRKKNRDTIWHRHKLNSTKQSFLANIPKSISLGNNNFILFNKSQTNYNKLLFPSWLYRPTRKIINIHFFVLRNFRELQFWHFSEPGERFEEGNWAKIILNHLAWLKTIL